MNRTDRLYALVEELRAIAPRSRTSRALAERFEVSIRTIERDLSALQQAGVPIWATPGPGGGYSLDPDWSLPPVNFTPAEAVALAVATARAGSMPYADAAHSALRKLLVAMAGDAAVDARDLADRVRLFADDSSLAYGLDPTVEQAVLRREVLRITYEDANGSISERDVEPVGFIGNDDRWYLLAWCRARSDGRSFRVDRIRDARLTGETAPPRSFDITAGDIPVVMRLPTLAE